MSRERESKAREVLRRRVREAHGFESIHRDHEDTLVAAMMEFAAPSTPVQSAASTLYETGDSLKAAREAAASGMPPIAAAAIRKGLWDADDHVQGRLRAMEALRERCARVADAEAEDIKCHAHSRTDTWQSGRSAMARTIAADIRAIEIKGE